jgi:hypothetical protein
MIHTLVLLTALVTAAPEMEARLVAGGSVSGTLSKVTADRIWLETSAGQMSLKRDELLTLGPKDSPATPAETPAVWVELIDGSTLIGTKYEAAKMKAQVTIAGNDRVSLSTKQIRFVRFSPPNEALDAQWAKALDAKASGDLLVVRKREALDQVEGILGDVDGDKVVFELDREPMEVKRPRVDGFIFAQSKRELPDAVCTVEDAGGWRLQAQGIELLKDQLVVSLTTGGTIQRPLDRIAKIDFSASSLRYLSDLNPESVEWTPFFSFPKEISALTENFKPRRDRDLEGGPIRLGGNRYAKGLGLTSRTTVVYRVPAGFRAFKALTIISAPSFQLLMVPSSDLPMMASSEDSTMEANLRRASSALACWLT